jgi:hypothetical protein
VGSDGRVESWRQKEDKRPVEEGSVDKVEEIEAKRKKQRY